MSLITALTIVVTVTGCVIVTVMCGIAAGARKADNALHHF